MAKLSPPLISVITPVVNGQDHVEPCVLSVQAANFSSFEHLICDGGSKDETYARACAMAQRELRGVEALQVPDRSMTEGLENARKRANGEWIAPLNIDDQYLPGVGPVIEAFLRATDADAVFFNVVVRRHDGSFKHVANPWLCGSALAWDTLGCLVGECGFMVRRATLEKVGGYDLTYRLAADYDLYKRLSKTAKVVHAAIPLGLFNETTENVSHTQKDLILAEASRVSSLGSIYAWMQRTRLDKLLRCALRVQRYDVL